MKIQGVRTTVAKILGAASRVGLTKAQAQKWVTALRSGKYAQTRTVLCESDFAGNNSYCCLGVLREIRPGTRARASTETLHFSILPSEIQDRLVELNDDEGWNFNQIAGYIERYILPHLPK